MVSHCCCCCCCACCCRRCCCYKPSQGALPLAEAGVGGLESLVDLKKRGLKTGKQHGLAGSRRPFSNHFSPTSDVKTLRLNPLKNVRFRFRSSFWWFPCKRNHGFGPHFLQSQRHTSLQNGKRISGSHSGWFPCKCCRNHTRKPRGPQETRPQNGKTAWPGRLTKAIQLFPHLRCQNVASESSKKCKVSFQLLVVSLQTKPWFWTTFPAKPAAHIAPKRTKKSGSHFWWFPCKCDRNQSRKSFMDLQKRGLKTGKQHGLAGSRRPFFNHFSPTSDVKTLRLNPLKNVRFRSSF